MDIVDFSWVCRECGFRMDKVNGPSNLKNAIYCIVRFGMCDVCVYERLERERLSRR